MSFSLDHHFYGPTAYRKSRPASLSSSSGYQTQRRRPAYSQPSSHDGLEIYSGDITRRSEKEILQTLNDRFAGYIDKVRNLELHNSNLEAEAAALRQSQTGRASVGEHYERELGDLRCLVQQLTGEKAQAILEHEHLEEDIQHVRTRLEDEARNREEIEAAVRAMNKYVEECGLARNELDKKLRALQDESDFIKKNHEEEVAELLAQIQGSQVNFEVRDTLKADVTSALREIRAQLDGHATKSATHAEEWFKARMENLSDAARTNTDAIRGAQEEIGEYRRQLQSRTIELETLRGTKESLERQRMVCEDRHQADLNSLQDSIHQLDNELKSTKWEMAGQLREYQELLNVKMALDIEIAAYRKLLEGEETRFQSGSVPYSYLDGKMFAHLKMKGEDMSDTVIVEEQTDETQVTEVTEEGDEDEGEGEGEKEVEEEGDESKEVDEKEDDKEENDKEEDGDEEKGEEEEKAGEEEEEEKSKSPGKAASPPSKSPQSKSPPKTPQPKSPAVKSPESKSPEAKSPMPKSPAKSPVVKSPVDDKSKSPEPKSPAAKTPVSKSPPSKSPESKSPPSKTPEPKSPVHEKAKTPEAKDTPKEEQKDEKPPKEEKKEKEKKPEPKQKEEPESKAEKTDKPEPEKDSKEVDTPKKADSPNPAAPATAPSKTAEEKSPSKSPAKTTEEKPSSPQKEDKAEVKAAPETDSKKEEKKPEEKTEEKKTEEKKTEEKEEKKTEEKKDAPKAADSKDAKEGAKMEVSEKSSGTDAKQSKEEKAKK